MINTSSTTSIQNRQWLDDYHSGPSADSSAPDALPIQSDWSSWQPIFKSRKSHITLDLGLTLYGFARPDDSWNVVAHEMVHSLDAYGNDNKDGLPVFSTEQDQQIFIREREELYADFFSTSPTLPFTRSMEYGFTNEKEFFARFSELFLSNQTTAETVRTVSPELYGVLSRFYDVTYP